MASALPGRGHCLHFSTLGRIIRGKSAAVADAPEQELAYDLQLNDVGTPNVTTAK